jgi:hypothetical protein
MRFARWHVRARLMQHSGDIPAGLGTKVVSIARRANGA